MIANKLKKIMAGMLSAAMIMSTMAVSVLAAGPDTILQNTGSLTINKYEGNDTTTPLEGVEFTLYKIADITQTVSDGVVNTKATPVASLDGKLSAEDLAEIAEGTSSSDEWNSLLEKINIESDLTEYASQITNSNGQAVFTEVPIGIYAVAETDAPSQVVSKTANFIVSIPMTSDDGDNWIYDVIANPKNTTAYGGISLYKSGKVGNNTASALSGVKFVLQEKVDDKWSTIKDNLVTSSSGLITVEDLVPAVYRFVETEIGTGNEGYILDGNTVYEFELIIGEDGETHIWYDADGDGRKEDQGTTATGYTINVVNEKPTLDKTVKDGENWDNETDASIGDTVTWKVTASVPSKIEELKTYSLKDTMSSALTWVSEENANLNIETVPAVTLEKNTDYTLTVPEDNTAGGTWEITFTDAGKTKLAENDVTEINVTFNTVLNSSANVGIAGNLNTGELDYSNAIYPTEEPDNPNNDKEPKEDVIKDQASVYTFGMSLEKVDGRNHTTKLSGVTFDLYRYDGNETVTEEVLKEDGTKIAVSQKTEGTDGAYVADAAGTAVLTTDANGNITVDGLENGKYYLVETKTNADYNLLKEPVEIEINVVFTTKTETTTVTDESGNTTVSTTVETDKFTGGENNNGVYSVTIENNKGFELPTTGDAGTLLATLFGILLISGGVFVFVSSRKKRIG